LISVTMLLAASGVGAPKAPAPVITSFKPTSGAVGTFVTIVGSNLTGATVAFSNGTVPATTPVNPETANTATSMTTTVPVGAATGPIIVTTSAGTGTSATAFIVTAAHKPAPIGRPVISGFKPASGKPGTLVTITGNGFVSVKTVKFGGVKAKATQIFPFSKTKFSVKVPAGAKSGKITVTTAYFSRTSVARFTVR
jgi:hypothetical protein